MYVVARTRRFDFRIYANEVQYAMVWYGIVGHFTYNFVITVLDFSGVL